MCCHSRGQRMGGICHLCHCCSSIPKSNLQSRLVVYNLLYFTYAPQFIYQLSLPSSHSKFPFMISISFPYPLNLCHSEIKDMISARAWHISLRQVLTRSPRLLFSIGPIHTNLPSILWTSIGLEPRELGLDNSTSFFSIPLLIQQVFLRVYKTPCMYLVPYSWSVQYKYCIFLLSWVACTKA